MSITLAHAIKAARLRKGLKQQEIATALGISRSAIGQWEAGSNDPSTQNLIKLGQLLEVDLTGASEESIRETKKNNIFGSDKDDNHRVSAPSFDIPVTHMVAMYDGTVFEIPPGDHIAFVRRFDFFEEIPNIFAMVFASNVLSPKYEVNDIVYVDPDQRPTSGEYGLITTSTTILPSKMQMKFVRRILLIDDKRVITSRFDPAKQEDWPLSTLARLDRIIPEYELVRKRGKYDLPA